MTTHQRCSMLVQYGRQSLEGPVLAGLQQRQDLLLLHLRLLHSRVGGASVTSVVVEIFEAEVSRGGSAPVLEKLLQLQVTVVQPLTDIEVTSILVTTTTTTTVKAITAVAVMLASFERLHLQHTLGPPPSAC